MHNAKTEHLSPPAMVSVVMPAYNAESYIAQAVDSILEQTFADFELIVVNDASADRTAEVLRGIDDPRLRVIHNSRNLKLSKSANIAINLSVGKYIARQDADDISLPQWLEKQVAYMEANPNVALLGTATYTLSRTGEKKQHAMRLENPTFADLLKGNQFTHGSVMMRADAFKAVGGYSDLFYLAEDYELWLRIAGKFKVANLPARLYILRDNPGSSSAGREREQLLSSILARENALNKVSADTLAEISAQGIDRYYSLMPQEVKMFYHYRLAKRYRVAHRKQDAIREYKTMLRIGGWNWKIAGKLMLLHCRRIKP